MPPKKYKALRGLRYPKSKTVRDQIRAGEKTSADVTTWVRVKEGGKVTLPPDIADDYNKRGDCIEEV